MKARILVDVNDEEERAAAAAWFARWRSSLTYVSENDGCGCCVDIWDVEGPEEAISDLPESIQSADSEALRPTDGHEGQR